MATTSSVPGIDLGNGVAIPQFGFGVFQIPPGETADAVRVALDAGYRHIDTAQMYRNEEGVGEGIRQSGLSREDVFVTTKLANDAHGHDNAITALEGSLRRLGTDYVDLYLIHWPLPKRNRYVETWQAFEEILKAGKARAIGVSNFQPAHLDELAANSGTTPAVNQIELHPYLQQAELREYHRRHGIATEAWSPIAQGEVLGDDVIAGIADRHGKSPAQVVLRWHIQLGNIVFPKSSTPERVRENIDIFDFELSEEDVRALGELDRNQRTGFDPDTFNG
ncbi:2,5-diketo-D-gluconate reductase A [Amycolatopsis bartoniae]|uniref:Oxidoreductase n=1 Tax=Amycolatopsis bartoniae TaxID=941986 RepID=A0A8H9J1N7_9PSEU|nr:aldo/keto reductase [Amycolatopsis bartoniae]MBB2934118.1 2,5-diketo-D-gluconate reductase A [Amycolatopsis bartoniae]TVT05500.1 aldo/keto reductase [Amycolatopsis bartoniae]GHF84227.1 oxidoreductase [Amycolatopsis bartoniae]